MCSSWEAKILLIFSLEIKFFGFLLQFEIKFFVIFYSIVCIQLEDIKTLPVY